METLFGCNSTNSAPTKETTSVTRKPVFPQVEQGNRVLDPKKSQNIAILLRALNVTRDEVSEALLDGKVDLSMTPFFLFLDIDQTFDFNCSTREKTLPHMGASGCCFVVFLTMPSVTCVCL